MRHKRLIGVLLSAVIALSNFSVYAGLTWSGSDAKDTKYVDIQLQTPNLGKYRFDITAKEKPSGKMLSTVRNNTDYFPVTIKSVLKEVDNNAPTAVYSKTKKGKVDIVFATGQMENQSSYVDSMNTFENLINNGSNQLDAKVKKVETSIMTSNSADAATILNDWDKIEIATGSEVFKNSDYNIWRLKKINTNKYQITTDATERIFAGFLNPSYDTDGDMDIEFTFGLNSDASDFGHGESGFLFRVNRGDDKVIECGKNGYNHIDTDGNIVESSSSCTRYGHILNSEFANMDSAYILIIDNHDACGLVEDRDPYIYFMQLLPNRRIQIASWRVAQYESGRTYNFRIKLTDNSIKIVEETKDKNGNINDSFEYEYTGKIGNKQLEMIKTGSYGFYTYMQTNAYFDNITVVKQEKRTLSDALSDISWRDGAARVIINASDYEPEDLQYLKWINSKTTENSKYNTDKYFTQYLSTTQKLINSDAYLINLGSSGKVDKNNTLNLYTLLLDKLKSGGNSGSNGILSENGSNLDNITTDIKSNKVKSGCVVNTNTRITNNGVKSSLWDDVIEIIKAVVLGRNKGPEDWYLVDTEIEWNTEYDDPEHDIPLNIGSIQHESEWRNTYYETDVEFGLTGQNKWFSDFDGYQNKLIEQPYKRVNIDFEKWRYSHNKDFFENISSLYENSGIWINAPENVFHTAGLYRVNYKRKDNPLNNVDLNDAFNSYRKWSDNYDYSATTNEVGEQS